MSEPQPSSGGGYQYYSYSGTGVAYTADEGYWNPTLPSGGASSTPLQPTATQQLVNGQVDYFSFSPGAAAYLRDSDGHQINWGLDVEGRTLTESHFASGTYWPFTKNLAWNGKNNLISSDDARANETDYAYDSNGNVIAVGLPPVASSAGTFRPTLLMSYDSFNNVTAACDPVQSHAGGGDWVGVNPGHPYAVNDHLCGSVLGSAYVTWDTADPAQPYGYVTDTYTPVGYHTAISYSTAAQSGGDYGLPTEIIGDAITQADTTTRTPHASLVYDRYGNVGCAATQRDGSGTRWSFFTFDAVNRTLSVADPDDASQKNSACAKTAGIVGSKIVSSVTYYANGQIASTQTPSQNAAGIRTTYAYDADGDELSETHHYGCTSTSGCSTGVTNRWYDGADRIVEIQHPTSGSEPPWIERYLYDLSSGAGVQNDGVTYKAYGNQFVTQKNNLTGGFLSEAFHSYDGLDRVISSYSFAPCPFVPGGSGQISCANKPVATTSTYDTSNNLGLLTSTVDPLGQSKTYAYNAIGAVTNVQYSGSVTPALSYGYDPDGRVTTSTAGMLSDAYVYNSGGTLASSVDAQSAKVAYSYYPDGLESALSVTSPTLNQANLTQYSYRTDGLAQTVNVQYGSSINQALKFAYTSAGRLINTTDFGTAYSRTQAYDSYGRVSAYAVPVGTYNNLTYDLEDQLTSYVAYGGETVTNQYGVRANDLLGREFSPNQTLSNGGTLWPSYSFTSVQGTLQQSPDEQVDARSGAVLGFLNSDVVFGYDNASELTTITAQGFLQQTEQYDAQHRMITGNTARPFVQNNSCGPPVPGPGFVGVRIAAQQYRYGPDGHVAQEGSFNGGNAAVWNLHYTGDSVLYSDVNAYSAGGWNRVADGIHVGAYATIGNIGVVPNGTKPLLDVTDRELSGASASDHNFTGHSAWTLPNDYQQPCSPQQPLPSASAGFTQAYGGIMTTPRQACSMTATITSTAIR